jgi:predicted O-methyltransferase YrrM
VPTDPALDAALADSAAAGLPAISVSPNQGKLLHLLARVTDSSVAKETGLQAKRDLGVADERGEQVSTLAQRR